MFKDKDIQDILELIALLERLAPHADKVAEAVLSYGPALKKVVEPFIDWRRRSVVEGFSYFLGQGMSREEALLLVLDERAAMMKAIAKIGKKSRDD